MFKTIIGMVAILFDAFIHRAFFHWGLFAYRYRFVLFTTPVFVTILLSTGFVFLKAQVCLHLPISNFLNKILREYI